MSAMGCKFLWARPLRSHETAGAQTTRSARSTTGTSNTTSDTSGICWIRRRNSSAPATTSTWSRCVFSRPCFWHRKDWHLFTMAALLPQPEAVHATILRFLRADQRGGSLQQSGALGAVRDLGVPLLGSE